MQTSTLTTLDRFMVRRKVFKIFGASFHVYDATGRMVGFSKQKAFRLKEDIRIYKDESMQEELLRIHARQIVDFSAAYDVIDSRSSAKIGAARRKGFSSILRDSWEVLDAEDRPVAQLREDSAMLALVRRFLSNLIPQRFHLRTLDGRPQAMFSQRFNPFVFKLDVAVTPGAVVDGRMILAVSALLAAIEGRQR